MIRNRDEKLACTDPCKTDNNSINICDCILSIYEKYLSYIFMGVVSQYLNLAWVSNYNIVIKHSLVKNILDLFFF